jgi:hypothetical protein
MEQEVGVTRDEEDSLVKTLNLISLAPNEINAF